VAKLEKGLRHGKRSFTQQMIERFDTLRGRYFYSRRLGTVEPVFANIRATLGMDRFTLRATRRSHSVETVLHREQHRQDTEVREGAKEQRVGSGARELATRDPRST